MRAWAFVAAWFCSLAQAAWTDEFAGLWLDPLEPGWGISMHHQGDHAVATILTYDRDGQAKWYQSRINLPQWQPYILWDRVTIAGDLREGGSGRAVGSLAFTFDEDTTIASYTIDERSFQQEVTRFVFRPLGLNGTFEGPGKLDGRGNCAAPFFTGRITAETGADNTVRLTFGSGARKCTAQGTYQFVESTPTILGRAQCTGEPSMADVPFAAGAVRVARDTMSVYLNVGDGACGYGGQLVAARVGVPSPAADPPHDDLTGLWTTEDGWSIAAHLQGNILFAMVLASDGKWYVAPDASYLSGYDGGAMTYSGDLWRVYKAPPGQRGYQVEPSGRLDFMIDEAGRTSAIYGIGVPAAFVTRLAWPRNDKIGGSYAGMRTLIQNGRLLAIGGYLEVSDDADGVRISVFEDVDTTIRCDIAGKLEWHGPAGVITGNGRCGGDPYDRREGPFVATEVRLDYRSITMRYSFGGETGYLVGLAR